MRTITTLSLLGAAALSAAAAAKQTEGLTYSGWAGIEVRAFTEDPFFPFQDDSTLEISAAGQADLVFGFSDPAWQIQLSPFGRIDSNDENRTHWDLREANIQYRGNGWDVLLGAHQVFWGRTETRNPVNVINQVDAVENFNDDNYLGQPMLNVNFYGDWGKLSFFGMTGFRTRVFPDFEGRLGAPRVNDKLTRYESDNEEWNPEFAVRYENSVSGFDYGVSYFHGNSREAQLIPITTVAPNELSPRYQEIDQVGFDAALSLDNVVLKTEMIYRWTDDQPFCVDYDPTKCLGVPDDFFAITAGLEWTLKNALDDGTDLGLLLEYSFDDRNQFNPVTIFDNDILLGMRASLNDADNTQFLGAFVFDLANRDSYLYFEASTRLGDDWRLSAEGRFFSADDNSSLRFIQNDDYVSVSAKYYF